MWDTAVVVQNDAVLLWGCGEDGCAEAQTPWELAKANFASADRHEQCSCLSFGIDRSVYLHYP